MGQLINVLHMMKIQIFLLALVAATVTAKPQGGVNHSNTLCRCFNPFGRHSHEYYNGEPHITCPRNGWCYVHPTADCRDKEEAQGHGRFFSTSACNTNIPRKGYEKDN